VTQSDSHPSGSAVTAGVDLGGTTVSVGLAAGFDSRVYTAQVGAARSADEVADIITGLVREAAAGFDLGAVGVGVPVPAGPKTDILGHCPNLPIIEGVPFRTMLEERLGVPVVLENDARCMVFGEYRAGALRGHETCACITLGSGLGLGSVVDGRILRGAFLAAGEIWHVPAREGVMLEDQASARGLRALAAGLTDDIRELFELWQTGDERARNVFGGYGRVIGQVACMVAAVLDPGAIAVGGGISRAADAFFPAVKRYMDDVLTPPWEGQLVRAELSDRAAVIGAAELAADRIARR